MAAKWNLCGLIGVSGCLLRQNDEIASLSL
jgi:hypothetical protein